MKKILTLILTVAFAAIVSAESISRVQIGDLYYNLDTESQTAEVTYKSYEYKSLSSVKGYFYNYEWDIATAHIPETVTYDEVPYKVTRIGESAFSDCANLQTAVIDSGVTVIDEYAFMGCKNLTSVSMPNSIVKIGKCAFSECESMTSVSIPASVTTIGSDAFYNKSGNLNAVYITDLSAWCKMDFEEYDWATVQANPLIYAHNLYLNGELVTDLVIPDDITEVKEKIFAGCHSFTSVTIHDNVSKVAVGAFIRCINIDSISIGKKVTEIETAAFRACTNLKAVTCKASTPPLINDFTFAGINCSEIPLYVPTASVELYNSTNLWKDFNPIIGIDVPKDEEGVERLSAPSSSTKIIRDGQLLIERNGKLYNVSGAEVK